MRDASSISVGVFDPDGALTGSSLVAVHLAAYFGERHETTYVRPPRTDSLRELSSHFGVSLSSVRDRPLDDYEPVPPKPSVRYLPLHVWRLLAKQSEISSPYDLLIASSGFSLPPVSRARHSLVYCHFPYAAATPGSADARSSVGAHLKSRLYRRLLEMRISSYDGVLANSRFTARWIGQRWNRDARVLHPPVSAEPPVLEKDDVVVSVGRFDAGDTKNHSATISAFQRFADRAPGDWRLCLIGSGGEGDAERRRLAELRERSRGYAVDFELGLSRSALLRRLARARLYWHSKGLGGRAEPAYQEHFGISTVEAMRARCVPVVPDAGGQPEIVDHGRSGLVCGSVEEMAEQSLRVIGDEGLESRLSHAARRRSRDFSVEAFERRLGRLLAELPLAGVGGALDDGCTERRLRHEGTV